MCSARLTFVDLDTGESITLGDGELITAENRITFTIEQLTDNRHYRVAINASNVAGSITSYATLSKDTLGGGNYWTLGLLQYLDCCYLKMQFCSTLSLVCMQLELLEFIKVDKLIQEMLTTGQQS